MEGRVPRAACRPVFWPPDSNPMSKDAPRPSIYLDNAATTRVLPEVAESMHRVLCQDYGNPSSRHVVGLTAEEHLARARRVVAGRMGVKPDRLIFTSGGTEANAMAILGVARRQRDRGHVLVSAVEHPSVLNTTRMLHQHEVETIPVTGGGWVDPDRLESMIRPDTFLVAVMHVNNETGVIQPVADIARVVHQQGDRCRLLVDAVQSFASLDTDLCALGAQMVTASAHKVHGPKGTGCLALAEGLHLAPLWGGGEQETGARPGTENVAGAVGFARALELSDVDPEHLASSIRRLARAVLRKFPGATEVGDAQRRVPHLVAITVPGLPSEVLVNMLEARGVCISSGAACHSRSNLRSHVMEAMGVPGGDGVIRISLSCSHTTAKEVARAVEVIEQLEV